MKEMKEIEKLQKQLEEIQELHKHINTFTTKYSKWHLDKLLSLAKFAMTLCPVQVGDRIELIKTPEISKEVSWGWLGAKHFLVEGAKGTVVDIDFSDYNSPHFYAYVIFDDETWIDCSTKEFHELEPGREHLYNFATRWLRKIDESNLS